MEVVRIFVIERETAIGVIALFGGAGLNTEERIDESGAGGLLIAGEKQGAVDAAGGAEARGEVDHSGAGDGGARDRSCYGEEGGE